MEKRPIIGVLIGNAHTSYPIELMRGISEASKKENADVIFFLGTHTNAFYRDMLGESVRNSYDYQFNTTYDYAMMADLDAMIVSFGTLNIFLQHCDLNNFLNRFAGVPYVVLEEAGPESPKDNEVYYITNNYGGMSEVIEHLITVHGFRKIAFIAGPVGSMDSMERENAYWETMKRHGFAEDKSLFARGDFTSNIEDIVEKMILEHPDLEAIAFANDEMAFAGYKVCSKLGKRVGKDIAITGFDNSAKSKELEPALTTVSQNEFDMGYKALQSAVSLASGKKMRSRTLPSQFCKRTSCGCGSADDSRFIRHESEDRKSYVSRMAMAMTGEIISTDQRIDVFEKYRQMFWELISHINGLFFDENVDLKSCRLEPVYELIDEILEPGFITTEDLVNTVGVFLQECLLDNLMAKNKRDAYRVNAKLQEYIFERDVKNARESVNKLQKQTWFIPYFAKDIMDQGKDRNKAYEKIVTRLGTLLTKSCYLYVFDEPKTHLPFDEWVCPDELYLAASQDKDGVKAYNPMPCVTKGQGLGRTEGEDRVEYTVFPLFSGERNYGVLVSEIDRRDMPFLYVLSIQIGTLLRVLEFRDNDITNMLESAAEQELEWIEEKEKQQSYEALYDEMTGVLNRQGFLLKAKEYMKYHNGKKAYMIYADLDHLMEINDKFGELEGDFAIGRIAMLLFSLSSDMSLIGRVEEDEFVAFMLSDNPNFEKDTRAKIKEICSEYNEKSNKPYFIEATMDISEFVCDCEMVVDTLLEAGRERMQKEKINSRPSVQK